MKQEDKLLAYIKEKGEVTISDVLKHMNLENTYFNRRKIDTLLFRLKKKLKNNPTIEIIRDGDVILFRR